MNLLLIGVASAQRQTEIFVTPPLPEATTCADLTFSVDVKNVANLTAFHLEIDFDPGSVEVLDVVNGGFLGEPDVEALFEPTNGFDNSTGKILFGVAQQGVDGDPTPRTGEGHLITITLESLDCW